jgi:hypothetical protein
MLYYLKNLFLNNELIMFEEKKSDINTLHLDFLKTTPANILILSKLNS